MTDKVHNELQDYNEMWIVKDAVLAFKAFPTQEQINEIRQILDSIEVTNHEFPIAHG